MEQLIQLIVWIVLFAIVAYGLYWVCTKFGLPQPVLWICGVVLILILLFALFGLVSGSAHVPAFRIVPS